MKIQISLNSAAVLLGASLLTALLGACNDPSADSRESGAAGPETPISSEMLRDYLGVQELLAADTIEGVGDPARALADQFAGAGEPNAAEAARLIGVTDDIEEARRQFETISVVLLERLKEGGAAEGEYHEVHCPMAFGNRGASWVQRGTTVNNPYFGSRMQTCGAIRETFAAADGSAEARAD